MDAYLNAARQVCGDEKQARVIAHIMKQQKLPASPVTAMLVMDDTVIPATENTHPLNVEIRERFEM